jgi:hypothetical protein
LFPLHAREREVVYKNFAEQASERKGSTEIICAENRGDRFFYANGNMLK